MKKIPKSIRKYVRKEKARIRRELLSIKERGEKLQKVYAQVKIPFSVNEREGDQVMDLKKNRDAKRKVVKGSNFHDE